MTNTEDELLDRLSGQTKLTALWQVLAAFTSYILIGLNPWFWIPVACAALAVALSAIEILWILPRLRRTIWENVQAMASADNKTATKETTL